MRNYKIYCLKDPETNEIRYVGVTIQKLNIRLSQHWHDGRHKTGTRKVNWIKSLHNKGVKPVIELIENCTKDNWEERECY